jgi:hypothetical protein
MSSSRPLRATGAFVAIALALLLAGCSGFRPVYDSGSFGRGDMAFRYSEPNSRLEQIVVQDLALRLGRNDADSSPLIRIIVQSSNAALTRTNVAKPATSRQATVTVNYTLVVDGRSVASGSRRASAQYTTSGQVMANDAALRDASERAAREAGELVRLAILGHLASPPRDFAVVR